MPIEIIYPTDKQHWLECRTKDITSTEISALFGISPYMTEFELYHRKKAGDIVKLEENERMKWGNALQDAIAAGVAEEQGWTVRKMTEYIRNPDLQIGASFDFSIETEHERLKDNFEQGLLEIKNVDGLQFKKEWLEDDEGDVEAPLHIEIQVQHQLMVSGRSYAYIAALIGGNRLQLIKREANPKVFTAIQNKVVTFWQNIKDGVEPQPNFERDAEYIAQLYKYAEPGKLLVVDEESRVLTLAEQYNTHATAMKEADAKRKAVKAEILTLIGDAEKVQGPGFSISAGIVGESPRNFIMPAYRNCRIYWKGDK